MISNRNVESHADYRLIKNYIGASNNELKKTRAVSIDAAIDNVVRKVPGGEFLKNVKIYVVKNKYYAVEGDVWGFEENQTYRGFKVGDKVQFKYKYQDKTGTITALKDDKTCLIKPEGEDTSVEVEYDKMVKIE